MTDQADLEPLQAACAKGLELHKAGRLDAAEALYKFVLAREAAHFDALQLLGALCLQRGEPAAAADLIGRAVEANPLSAQAHARLGMALWKQAQHTAALNAYDRALQLQPDLASAHNDRGTVLAALGRHQEAVLSHQRAIQLAPAMADAHCNLGAQLHHLQRYADALACHDRAIALKPAYAAAHCNRGSALKELGRGEEAIASFREAIRLDPAYAEAFCNLGMALIDLRRLPEAIQSFDTACALAPGHPGAHLGRSFARLLSGDLKAGFQEFSSWRSAWDASARRVDRGATWNGEDLSGKTLFLYSEQGLGDAIQFSRFVGLFDADRTRIVLSAPDPLGPLLRSLYPRAEIIGEGSEPERFDYHCSLMTVPVIFGVTLDSIPPPPRYPGPDPALRRHLEEKLGPKARPRVGLAWSGNPAHNNDRNRSIPFRLLAPLLHLDADFVAVQDRIQPRDQIDFDRISAVRFLGEELKDFAATAALVDLMDLVVTVDTSLAHLSGTVGKPTLVLLPFSPEWRWLLDRPDTPWYPAVRLYRQPAFGDWASVVTELDRDLPRILFKTSP